MRYVICKENYKMSILKELYNGNITPSERFVVSGSNYSKLLSTISEKEDELFKKLSHDEKTLYESIAEKKLMLESISEEEIFIDGFRLGAQIMLEIIQEPNKQFFQI